MRGDRLVEARQAVALDDRGRAPSAPVRTPTTVALMSPATIFGTRELAVAKRKMSATSRPREKSLTPGKIVPSWKTSTVSVEYGSLPPMSSQCALMAA